MSKLIQVFNKHIVANLDKKLSRKTEMRPDIFQQPIIERLGGSSGEHIFADAVAGSGKSSLIEMACGVIEPQNRTEVRTSHSHGVKALSKNKRIKFPPQSGDYKYANIIEELCDDMFPKKKDSFKAGKELREVVSFAMQTLVDTDDETAMWKMIDDYGIELTYPEALPLVKKAINKGIQDFDRYGNIGFIDMIYLPIALDLEMEQFDFVLADEAQDYNALQLELSKRSLKPNGSCLYVGDPFQSCYGFMGALPDSCGRIIREMNCIKMPLSYCYRCPTSHLDLARKIVPHVENAPNAKEGIVEYTGPDKLHEIVTNHSMILCRFTAPLIKNCIRLISKGIPATVKGSDIGRSIVSVVRACEDMEGGTSIHSLVETLSSYRQEQYERLSKKKNNEVQVEAMYDKVDAVRACFDAIKPRSFDELSKYIETLFSDKDSIITLSTIHRAKGLEADHVIILNGDKCKLPVMFKAALPWQQQQERNIHYVALTRSKNRLTIIGDESINYENSDAKLEAGVQLTEKPQEVIKVKSINDSWAKTYDERIISKPKKKAITRKKKETITDSKKFEILDDLKQIKLERPAKPAMFNDDEEDE